MNSKHPYKRVDRVNDLLRKIISEVLMSKVHHQGLDGVIITSVKTSADLQHARVFYRVLDPSKLAKTRKALEKASKVLQRETAHEMHTRYTPILKFEYDDSLEYGNRIESLLDSVRKKEGG